MYTLEQVKAVFKSKGYVWFSDPNKKGYDVNVFGIRNSSVGNKVTNLFDDLIGISYFDENEVEQLFLWAATTDAGKKGVQHFHNPKGVARLIPNQYRGAMTIRKHQNDYEALCQQKPMDVWRDANKNLTFEEVIVDRGTFGINIHRSNPKTQSEYVENWSEGCQVFKRVKDFNEFMKICKKAKEIHGNSFTYTLIESKDIV